MNCILTNFLLFYIVYAYVMLLGIIFYFSFIQTHDYVDYYYFQQNVKVKCPGKYNFSDTENVIQIALMALKRTLEDIYFF